MIKTEIAVVTGCAGFIGSALTRYLLKNNWYVYGIDKLTYASNPEFIEEFNAYSRFKFIHEDIANLSRLPECDVIFNLAAESDVDTSNRDSRQFVLSNVLGVQNLLNLVSKSAIIKDYPPLFFQISTDEVYGATKDDNYKFVETDILNPSNPYSATKAAADLLITSWANTYNIKYIIARPSNNYGYYQHPEKLIPLTVKKLARGQKIKLHNQGSPVRTWTHVEDTINAIKTIYYKGEQNSIYNISSELEESNLTIVTDIIKAFHNEEYVNIDDYVDLSYNRPGQDMRYAICSKKLSDLGWRPSYNVRYEINNLVSSYKHGKFRW